jgi:hypothetical protein
MHNGWGGYVLTQENSANAFFSHDEFIDFYSDRKAVQDEILSALRPQASAE